MNLGDNNYPTISSFLRHYFGIDVYSEGRVHGNRIMIRSPFRDESHPSFDIRDDRLWHDHGSGEGGGVWQLAYKYLGEENKSKAYRLLQGIGGVGVVVDSTPRTASSVDNKQSDRPGGIKILGCYPLNNVHLLDYIHRRGVDVDVARKYCNVVVYLLNQKKSYSIGFLNDSGGYELRSEYLKLSSSPKDVTLLRSDSTTQSDSLLVFEGFFDFLSHKTLEKEGYCPARDEDYLILNGVGNVQLAKEKIGAYRMVRTMLDNDMAGDEATKRISELCTGGFEDLRDAFSEFNDLNEYLQCGKGLLDQPKEEKTANEIMKNKNVQKIKI